MATAQAQLHEDLPVALLATWSTVLALVLALSAYISFGPEPPSREVAPLVMPLPPLQDPPAAMARPETPADFLRRNGTGEAVAETEPEAEDTARQDTAAAQDQTPPAAVEAAPTTDAVEASTADPQEQVAAATAEESGESASDSEAEPARESDAEVIDSAAAEAEAETATAAEPVAEPTETAAREDAQPTQAEAPPAAAPSSPQVAVLRLPEPDVSAGPAWKIYRRPFDDSDTRPRIAVVITGLGLSESATMAAIKTLPPQITLSFTPYSRNLNQLIALARANGHEVMLDLPMEPQAFPDNDPGPRALLTGLAEEENLARLNWLLDRGTAYVGLASVMGSRFTASMRHMTPVLEALQDKGLLFLDNRSTESSVAADIANQLGLPFAINNRLVDERQASRVAIDSRLAQVERVALADGAAVAMARPFPVTFERVMAWVSEFEERGLVLAPITALANRQPLR